jgi:hypothetical protein
MCAAAFQADGLIGIESRRGGNEVFRRNSWSDEVGSGTSGPGAAKARKYLRWQSLLARQTRQILLAASNSFPKQGASENLGSRMGPA